MELNKQNFRENLLSLVMPFFNRKGFEEWEPKVGAETLVIYLRRPFGSRLDLLDVQFDKYGRTACFVNLAQVEGKEVVTQYDGVLAVEDVTSAHLNQRCRLRGSSFSGMFRPLLFARILGPQRSANSVAKQIFTRFDAADQWFVSKRASKFIQCYNL